MNRREFLATTAVVAGGSMVDAEASAARPATADWRADFPAAQSTTYLNSAAMHPLSLPAARALQAYADAQVYRKTRDFDADRQAELKQRFARLINAKAHEIAFVQNTSDGENIVV